MSGDDGAAQPKVPNPYLAAIKSAKTSAAGPGVDLEQALKAVKSAMNGNCWQSKVADSFFHALTHHETTLSKCRSSAIDEFDEAIAGEPEMVDANSWQVHWHNLGR